VGGAQESIHFLAFSFTADELADALIEAEARGVEVRGVFEASQVASNTGGEWGTLDSADLDIRQDGQRGEMHHKVLIIDGSIVVSGSYNFSRSAEERNDENTLVISSRELAALFEAEFIEIWNLTE
jgi:phosphatidylserine/phosphatidylglycerophosphate/cardiolipin synthase-like enzyme